MSTETKFTPGPWRIDENRDPPLIVGRPSWPCRRSGVEGEWDVAELDDLCGDNPVEVLANASLIAAAPDLYEDGRAFLSATERLCDWLNGNDLVADHAAADPEGYKLISETMVAFRAALAKAVRS